MAISRKRARFGTIAVVRLSSGCKVKVSLEDHFKGIDGLTNALIGEVFLPVGTKKGWKKGVDALQKEVATCVCRMRESEKDFLLSLLIVDLTYQKWEKIRKRLRKSRELP